jgi:ParB-like chromosome segregation protein Spo0J
MKSWKHYCDENNWHEAAKLFPMLSDKDASELADDIDEHGLQNPIILLNDRVLDGRNRLLARPS